MIDYVSLLSRMLKATGRDTAESRAQAYDRARAALRRKLMSGERLWAAHEADGELFALDQAILQVEAHERAEEDRHSALARLRDQQRRRRMRSHLGESADAPVVQSLTPSDNRQLVIPPLHPAPMLYEDPFVAHAAPLELVAAPPARLHVDSYVAHPPSFVRQVLSLLADTARLIIVAVAAVAIYAALAERNRMETQPSATPPRSGPNMGPLLPTAPLASAPAQGSTPPPPAVAASKPTAPRPSVYGVFAVDRGELRALSPAETAPVDPRARNVLQINQPGRTHVASGPLSFIIYRRELAMSAPEQVPIRVVARIARVMRFESTGSVTKTAPTDAWLIRGNGFDYRVLPLPDDREMVLVRPEDPSFVLPAGRYALLLSGAAYDFTVDGVVTDPAQCVESAPTARGPMFYDCPPK